MPTTEEKIYSLYENLHKMRERTYDPEKDLQVSFGENVDMFKFRLDQLITEDMPREQFIDASKEETFFNGYVRNLKVMHSYFVKPVPNVTKLYFYRDRESALDGSIDYSDIIIENM